MGAGSQKFSNFKSHQMCVSIPVFAMLVQTFLNQYFSDFFPLLPASKEILIPQIYYISLSILGGEVTYTEIACSVILACPERSPSKSRGIIKWWMRAAPTCGPYVFPHDPSGIT